MQTAFSPDQLADPHVAEAEAILRKCVHCGFCTATCPTYVTLGNELDSPRGRIYLIKEMLEKDQAPTAEVVKHIDRCLSCLACMTTCPSGVNYMHLVDHGRHRIEESYRRPLADRLMRDLLAWLMPRPALFRWAMVLGRLARRATTSTGLSPRHPCAVVLCIRVRRHAPAAPITDVWPHGMRARPGASMFGGREHVEKSSCFAGRSGAVGGRRDAGPLRRMAGRAPAGW